ncbi:MAG TPA: indolepyruvate ferredoxin oxidoreductase family protein [Rubrivivax sp.]|nr:indolepyruvate ferredoxin oxidoreductase family protein [Rubrivivax sp.]
MTLAAVDLDDKYRLARGRVFLTGVQALVRLPMLQQEADRRAGWNTAGYVSGYRGSPLGGLDTALTEAKAHLAAHDIRFRPGVNEDLAATAVWGTQQLQLMPGADRDGIFAMWYGKGPGVDRSADVFKHANHAGTSPRGGVLVVAGDDHAARSSAVAHQSEHIFSACGIPVLAPAGVQDILDYGLHGWAMSRYAGLWVGLKLSADIVESSATVEIDAARVQPRLPDDYRLPPDGVHIRWPDPQSAQEQRMQATKIYAALAYARANGLNRVVVDGPNARLGLLACGKAWLDLRQAMHDLGLSDERAATLGLRVMKVAMPWPLEADSVRRFATGLDEILVVEEKRQIIEYQLKEMLYDWRDDVRPRVLGKFDEGGEWPAPPGQWLLPPTGDLTPSIVARALASRLARLHPEGGWTAAGGTAAAGTGSATAERAPLTRTPYFCSGCPHNRSTRVPDGSHALAGVGCHLMAVAMERNTLTICQMGGEGATWIGMAEHAGPTHVFANMGDGTYFHSGLLAIRAAVAAGVNITYKLLYNDAVAMTGGQPVDGKLTVPQITRQLAAEGVARIVVLADDPAKYHGQQADTDFAPGVPVRRREELEAVQHELREVPGTTVLIYDQTCATEARRRRKRGVLPARKRHVVIHEAVCEGCGDCALQSNCLSVVPVETEFGRKRAIDQFSCNLDLSCLEGYCPALLTVEGGTLRRAHGLPPPADIALPEPELPALAQPYSLLVAGVGGTGVVTIGALLGMAAHLEGRGVTVLDQTGLAQKGGAVLTHVRFAARQDELQAPRIVRADAVLACDMLVAAGVDATARMARAHTQAIVNTADVITGDFLRHPEMPFPHDATLAFLGARVARMQVLDATRLATQLAGHSIATNMFMLGWAWQRGLIPVGREAIVRAVELNKVAVDDNLRAFAWGRIAAHDPERAERCAREGELQPASQRLSRSLDEMIERRGAQLVDYQGAALAQRYRALVQRVRAAEQAVNPQSEALTRAVAQQAWRLLAVKDEYEVARLLSDRSFDAELAQTFEGGFSVQLHLMLPWKRPRVRAGSTDRPPLDKRAFGPWMRRALGLLAHGKVLRGTVLDPFGYSTERRLERQLMVEYEQALERLLRHLSPALLEDAAEIAALPDAIRGFGWVKRDHAERTRKQIAERLSAYEAAAAIETQGGRPAASAAREGASRRKPTASTA